MRKRGKRGSGASRGIREFQRGIEAAYLSRDRARGLSGTFLWFAEEVGELARALKRGEPRNLREEFADCLAWLSTLASLAGVDLEEAAARYEAGCPRCGAVPCRCPPRPIHRYPARRRARG